MAAIDDIEIPSLLLAEQGSAPPTPASGFGRLYIKSDGVYFVGDDGTETGPFGTGGGGSASGSGVRTYKSGNQTCSDAAETALTFDTEAFDDDGYHSTVTNTSRFTIPSGFGGLFNLSGAVVWNSVPLDWFAYFKVNGTTIIPGAHRSSSAATGANISSVVRLTDGQYVELIVYNNNGSGTSRDARGGGGQGQSCSFSLARIGD